MPEEVLTATRWMDLVAEIPPSGFATFPSKHKNTIRFEISGRILKNFPDRLYKTWIDKEEKTLTVYRIK